MFGMQKRGKMIKTAIILAAGFGTRLQTIVSNIPKPMAKINGKPLLEYILINLEKQGFDKVVFHTCYLSHIIKNYFGDKFNSIDIIYSEVKDLVGTGGGIKKSLELVPYEEDILVINGDSFFDIDIQDFYYKFKNSNSIVALSLKRMEKYDRYGTVTLDKNNNIIEFKEKKYVELGLINCGVYLIKNNIFNVLCITSGIFSFEKDCLEKFAHLGYFSGFVYDRYFIDIGIPEDYRKAQKKFIDSINKYN